MQAIEIIEENVPDLVLMDIKLPKLSGFEIIKTIKSQNKTREIPIIAVTALAMNGDKERILASGFDDYIPKPLSARHLLAIIRQHLE